MALRPTATETAARHREKLLDHEFVEVPGSRLCGHGRIRTGTLGLTLTGGRVGVTADRVRCNQPRRNHRT